MNGFVFSKVSPSGHSLVPCGSTSLALGSNVCVGEYDLESEVVGFEGVLLGFTRTHGYAFVYHEASCKCVLVHPESLVSCVS